MLAEIVLLVSGKIRQEVADGKLAPAENGCIDLDAAYLEQMILSCRREWKDGWSKEYREMEEQRLTETVLDYMESWLMIRQEGEKITVFLSAARTAGVYPEDFNGGTKE